MAEAIGTLKAYAFITQRGEEESFDLHRLVRLAMMSWLRGTEELEVQFQKWTTKVMERLAAEFPKPEHNNRSIWIRYLPHVHHFLHFRERREYHPAEALLQSRIGSCLYTLGNCPHGGLFCAQRACDRG